MRVNLRADLLVLVPIAASACAGRPRPGDDEPDRAVVVYARERTADAETARNLLFGAGYLVDTQVAAVPRERSAVSVYEVGDHPDRPKEIEELLAPIGPIEVLPFHQRGSGGNDVVLWLVEEPPRSRPE